MKLFIEEANEELAKIRHNFPVWDENPLERDALITVRRSFHTLKGSGRMVGARELGEFAWSIENLLNRVLDNTLTRSPAILETLRAAVAALPELIAQLEHGSAVQADVLGIASRAHALAAGKPSARARAPGDEDTAETPVALAVTGTRRAPVMPPAAAAPPPPRPPRRRRRYPMTRCATSTRAKPPPTSPPCARTWRARRSSPSRTRSPRRSTAPATRSPGARRWRRRATASASPSRSITGCGAPSAADWG